MIWRRPAGAGRLATAFGLAFALSVGLAGAIVFLATTALFSRHVDGELTQAKLNLLPQSGNTTLGQLEERIAGIEASRAISERAQAVFDKSGRQIFGRIALSRPDLGFSNVTFRDQGSKLRDGRALAVDGPEDTRLVIVAHSELAESALESLLPLSISTLLAATMVGLFAAWLFTRQISRRLMQIRSAADAIAAGDLSRRVPVDQLDGMFAEQAASFNGMLDRMEDILRSQRQFSGNVAHDLRTPLTRLYGLLRERLDCELAGDRTLLERAERECASIIAIFDALLRLSEIEAGRHASARQPLELKPFIEEIIESIEPVIADAGSTLITGHIENAVVMADPALFTQLLVNLLENIALHTPAGTIATVSLQYRTTASCAILSISDNGPGLTDDERSRVVRPFERGTSSSTGTGSGLGLAIAQSIVRFHGGELLLSDNEPGLCVQIRLPAEAAALARAPTPSSAAA